MHANHGDRTSGNYLWQFRSDPKWHFSSSRSLAKGRTIRKVMEGLENFHFAWIFSGLLFVQNFLWLLPASFRRLIRIADTREMWRRGSATQLLNYDFLNYEISEFHHSLIHYLTGKFSSQTIRDFAENFVYNLSLCASWYLFLSLPIPHSEDNFKVPFAFYTLIKRELWARVFLHWKQDKYYQGPNSSV